MKSRLLTSLKPPIYYRRLLVDACSGDEIQKCFRQGFALYPRDNCGWDCKYRQGSYGKVYVGSVPPVRQSKQSDSKGDLAQGNGDDGYCEFGCTVVDHAVEMTQVH
jgi:hypothetical protein